MSEDAELNTPSEAAAYIASLLSDLARLARAQDLKVPSLLIDMSWSEAQAGRGRNGG
jgi:hypothetical protein